MLDLTWRLFCMTGSIDSYLLIKELENEAKELPEEKEAESGQETAGTLPG